MLWAEAGGSYAPTRLALELAGRGHPVLFLEHRASTSRETRGLPIRIASLDEMGLPGLAIALAWRGVPLGSLDEITPRLAAWLDENETPNTARIAVLNAPFAPLARLVPFLQTRGYWIVYYPQDDYAAMFELGMHQFNPQLGEYLVAHADLNLALAAPVAEKLKRGGRTVELVPDAVEPSEFRDAFGDAPNVLRGAKCTLGFWGALMPPMVDGALVRALAEARPEWAINLLGPYEPPPQYLSLYEQLRHVPNIRFHGAVPRAELKQYARAFDVCIIPAPDNDMSRGRDPIKLYEYLAAYKPVVAAHMPQLRHTPYVRVVSNTDEFIAAVDAARRERIHARVLDEFLAQHTWGARAETFLELMEQMLRNARARVGTFDANELERLERAQPVGALAPSEWEGVMYSVREQPKLARELSAVQNWARELEAAQRAHQQTLPARVRGILTGK